MPDTEQPNDETTEETGATPPETPPETPEAAEHPEGATGTGDDDAEAPEDDGRTFSYDYVRQLRDESKGYRTQLRDTETQLGALQQSLWDTKLAALGRLADPTDLPMPEGADPTDDDAISAAVTELLERKPHLAARRANGNIGQHDETEQAEDSFSILGTMQQHA